MPSDTILFPGQGAQVLGMGSDVYDKSPAGRAVFDMADKLLPFSLTDAIFNGPAERLTETQISQPAILVTSMALVAAMREAGWDGAAAATAGLSLGEYTALAFAGVIPLEDAIVLVHKRGTYMREAGARNPGSMLSVIGLDEAAVADVVSEASDAGLVVAANLNCPGQVVLSGEVDALEAAEKIASEKGAIKCIMLKVDGAFHSPLMREAADRLAADLDAVKLARPSVPFVANTTADFVEDPGEIRDLLVSQVTCPVLWEKSMTRLASNGSSGGRFVEVGPGRVLTGLMRRINRKLPALAVGGMTAAADFARG